MDKQLLDILVCPVTGMAVTLADDERLAAINTQIAQGEVRYADGSPVERPLTAALVTRDQATAYRVDDGIPVMLPERGIELPPPAP
jgi:uncharacterized protein YbaR (Trm112 family)